MTILNWMENLPSDEMPDHWKWHLDWEIASHFEKVKEDRDRKYGTNKSSSDSGTEQYEENAYATRFK